MTSVNFDVTPSNTYQYLVQDYEKPLFGTSLGQSKSSEELELKVSQMLCLPVSAGELLQSNHAGGVSKEYTVDSEISAIFFFRNSIKRHISDVKNSRLRQGLPISIKTE